MTDDPLDDLSRASLPADPNRRREAWLAARAVYRRSAGSKPAASWWRFFAPAASIAALVLALAALRVSLRDEDTTIVRDSGSLPDQALRHLFIEGRSLFGDQLLAVTFAGDEPIWQLAAANAHEGAAPSPVVIVALIRDSRGNSMQVAALPGVPVEVPYDGKTLRIEFLPTACDQVMAVGSSVVWNCEDKGSPLAHHSIEMLPR